MQVFASGTRQSGGLDASELCQVEIAADARLVEVARDAASAALDAAGDGNAAATTELAAAAAAFAAAASARQRTRTPLLFGDDGDDSDSSDDELLGIAV
eukprot:358750-Chlamydomonas_euryale.AAC.1